MKKKKYILNGCIALTMMLMLIQCTQPKANESEKESPVATTGSTNLKIAYVEIDSLLTKYRYWNDLNELMIQKEENIRTTLNEKAKDLDNDMREFQRKLENNGFVSRERAEQENLRITQKQRDLQELQEKLTSELQAENQKISLQLRDSINSFLKIYNKDWSSFGGTFDGEAYYNVVLYIADNGPYDLDGAEGTITDPTAIVRYGAQKQSVSGGSGGGCSAGFGAAALFALPALWLFGCALRKRAR